MTAPAPALRSAGASDVEGKRAAFATIRLILRQLVIEGGYVYAGCSSRVSRTYRWRRVSRRVLVGTWLRGSVPVDPIGVSPHVPAHPPDDEENNHSHHNPHGAHFGLVTLLLCHQAPPYVRA